MKIITDRYEFGKKVNFGKYPVVYCDNMEHDEFGVVFGKVRLWTGKDYFGRVTLRTYNDDNRLVTSCPGVCLADYFGYKNIVEDAQYAIAPVLRPDSTFIMVIDNRETKRAICLEFMTGGLDINCSMPLKILDGENMDIVVDAVSGDF